MCQVSLFSLNRIKRARALKTIFILFQVIEMLPVSTAMCCDRYNSWTVIDESHVEFSGDRLSLFQVGKSRHLFWFSTLFRGGTWCFITLFDGVNLGACVVFSFFVITHFDFFFVLIWKIAFEPFRTKCVDEDGTKGCSNADSEHSHRQHSLTPVEPFLIRNLTFL